MSTDFGGYVLDAGAFIGVERRKGRANALLMKALRNQIPMITSAGVVAQVWRGGNAQQVPLALLLARVSVHDLTNDVAKTLGLMLKLTRTRDPIDAHIVYLAREYDWPILTSDPNDILSIDPTVTVEAL